MKKAASKPVIKPIAELVQPGYWLYQTGDIPSNSGLENNRSETVKLSTVSVKYLYGDWDWEFYFGSIRHPTFLY